MFFFFSKRVQRGINERWENLFDPINGCSREFNVLLPVPDRAGDSRLLDSILRLALRSTSYGPLNSFRNTRDNCIIIFVHV